MPDGSNRDRPNETRKSNRLSFASETFSPPSSFRLLTSVDPAAVLAATALFVYCFQHISDKTIWAFVTDAPTQAADPAAAAKVLDDLTDEGHVVSWVKNAFLDFHIPYTDIKGEQREYFPDFIVRCRNGEPLNLVLEITGMTKDKPEKKWTVENRWLPAVNRIREQHGWDKWDFLEIASESALADLRNLLLGKISQPPVFGTWKHKQLDGLAYQQTVRAWRRR